MYVFGDLHGRFDLLRALAALIGEDLAGHPIGETQIVGLGDYIDRGSESRAVIDLLVGQFFASHNVVCLKGNHEALLLDFLDRPAVVGPTWLQMGGWECLTSYGVDCRWQANGAEEFARIRQDFARQLPPEHIGFFSRLALSKVIGDYFFAHAGARPGVPLDRQTERDLLWIRGGFVDRDERFEKVIVHGHTAVAEPFVGRYRINLDTGAYATGRLTCMVLEADRRRFLEARA